MFPRRRGLPVSPLPVHSSGTGSDTPSSCPSAPPGPSSSASPYDRQNKPFSSSSSSSSSPGSFLSTVLFASCFAFLGLVFGVFFTLLWTRFVILPGLSPAPPPTTTSRGVAHTDTDAHAHASLVLMHWKRDEALNTVMLAACSAKSVTEVVVWDANPETTGSTVDVAGCESISGGSTVVRVVSVSHDLGLQSRFAAAQLTTNDAVIIMDDDMLMTPEGVDAAVAAWAADPDVLHGLYGRWPTQTFPYNRERLNLPTAPIVLTKFLVAHRKLFAEFFKWAPAAEHLPAFRHGKPRWNGEDIVFALAVLRANNGRQHKLHPELKAHLTEVSAGSAVSGGLFVHEIFRREFVGQLTPLMGFRWPASFTDYPSTTEVTS